MSRLELGHHHNAGETMSEPDKRLWTGHCWLCGARCMEVVESFPQGHALAGQPRKFGKPEHGAKRITFVLLASGRTASMTFCASCEPEPRDMPLLASLIQLRSRIDDSPWYYEAVHKPRLTDAQKLERLGRSALFHIDVPLGEIARQPLSEVT